MSDDFYTDDNLNGIKAQLEHNIKEKDKMILALATLFLGGTLTLKPFYYEYPILLILLIFLFSISVICSLIGFNEAAKQSDEQYKILCEGRNDPTKKLSFQEYALKEEAIKKKYKSRLYDKAAFYLCISGIILFILFSGLSILLNTKQLTNQNAPVSISITTTEQTYMSNQEKSNKLEKSIDGFTALRPNNPTPPPQPPAQPKPKPVQQPTNKCS